MTRFPEKICHWLLAGLASGLLTIPPANAALDADSLETTIKLINGMVAQGALARDKAAVMIRDAQNKESVSEALRSSGVTRAMEPVAAAAAPGTVAATTSEIREILRRELLAEMKGELVADIKRQVLSELSGPGPATPRDAGADSKSGQGREAPASRVVRVPYVPEVVRREIHDQIRQEVLAQAKSERWGDPGALPDWLNRIKWEGDLRLRYQTDLLDKSNAPGSDYVTANQISPTTRAPDLGTSRGNASLGNTQEQRDRMRLRARLGMLAKIGDDFSGAVRITTGNTTDRLSTNQTLGQNFNKYSLVLDRAFLRYEPNEWLSVTGGKIPNPWFATELVWNENLNFEGISATIGRRSSQEPFAPFLTVGTFPIREDNPPTRDNRWLDGAQAGFQWSINSRTRLKFGAAYYGYRNLEGHPEAASSFVCAPFPTCTLQNANYGKFEYESGLRQKGNTLFATNAPTDPSGTTAPIWGLASRFREVNLTASLDLAHWDPVHAVLIGDYVRNIGFKKDEILNRTGLRATDMPDGKSDGYLLKLQIGRPEIKARHEWNGFVAYRRLGSDAVLDAYTDSDFGLGGTNLKGYQIGFKYGLDRNVDLGLRWLSADAIDSMIPSSPSLGGLSSPKTKFSVDVLQLDLSARF